MLLIILLYIIFIGVLSNSWLKDKPVDTAHAPRRLDTFQIASKPIEQQLAWGMKSIEKVADTKIQNLSDINMQLAFMNCWAGLAQRASIDHRPEIVQSMRAFKAKVAEAQKTFMPKMRTAFGINSSYRDATGQISYLCTSPGATVLQVCWKDLDDEDNLNAAYDTVKDWLRRLRFKAVVFRGSIIGPIIKQIDLSAPEDDIISIGAK